MDRFLTTNRLISAIFGAEYSIPMSVIGTTSNMVAILKVIADKIIPDPFVSKMKIHACFLETKPEGIGLLLFELALSRSESMRSLRTYIPTAINSVMKGNGTVR